MGQGLPHVDMSYAAMEMKLLGNVAWEKLHWKVAWKFALGKEIFFKLLGQLGEAHEMIIPVDEVA
jgi:hypothetical protein